MRGQGRNNEVESGIKGEGSGIRRVESGITNHGIKDHKTWDRDQQFSAGSGFRLYHFCGIRDQNLTGFWNKGLDLGTKMGSAMKKRTLL